MRTTSCRVLRGLPSPFLASGRLDIPLRLSFPSTYYTQTPTSQFARFKSKRSEAITQTYDEEDKDLDLVEENDTDIVEEELSEEDEKIKEHYIKTLTKEEVRREILMRQASIRRMTVSDEEKAKAIEKTKKWVHTFVVGLNLCPFVEMPEIRYVVSDALFSFDFFQDTLEEKKYLRENPKVRRLSKNDGKIKSESTIIRYKQLCLSHHM